MSVSTKAPPPPKKPPKPKDEKPLSIEEIAESVLKAIRKVRLDRADLITLIVAHSRVRRPRYAGGSTRLTVRQTAACLNALEDIGKRYGHRT